VNVFFQFSAAELRAADGGKEEDDQDGQKLQRIRLNELKFQ
jgi:hypothetical protein